jgi:hypothetical protein
MCNGAILGVGGSRALVNRPWPVVFATGLPDEACAGVARERGGERDRLDIEGMRAGRVWNDGEEGND